MPRYASRPRTGELRRQGSPQCAGNSTTWKPMTCFSSACPDSLRSPQRICSRTTNICPLPCDAPASQRPPMDPDNSHARRHPYQTTGFAGYLLAAGACVLEAACRSNCGQSPALRPTGNGIWSSLYFTSPCSWRSGPCYLRKLRGRCRTGTLSTRDTSAFTPTYLSSWSNPNFLDNVGTQTSRQDNAPSSPSGLLHPTDAAEPSSSSGNRCDRAIQLLWSTKVAYDIQLLWFAETVDFGDAGA